MRPGQQTVVTVDVEGDHGTGSLRGSDEWVPWLLDRFDELGVRAVWFVVGDVALERPGLIRGMVERGHVVASHSMTHRALSTLDRRALEAELADSKRALEDVTGAACTGFRAPYFDAPSGLEVALAELGYAWSSSRAPWSPMRGRAAGAGCAPGVPEHPVGRLSYLPLPDGLSWRRVLWPMSGLAAPPAVFYLHPYELLDRIDGFAHPGHWRPLMSVRMGARARGILVELLDRWRRAGVRLDGFDWDEPSPIRERG